MAVGSHRRYCLLKAQYWAANDEPGLAAAWRGKHAEAEGTSLPEGFPSLTALAASIPAYTTIEDLTGASIEELEKYAGITRTEAEAVLAALEE